MSWIDGYRAFLEASRAAAASEPVVHAAQLAAMDRELAIARRADSAATHGALGGAPFEVTRAAWIDRVVGHARIGAALDDPWTVKACAIELAATLVGDSFAPLRDALVEVSPRAQTIRTEGAEALSCFSRLAICLVRLQAERRPTEFAELRRDVAACAEIVARYDRLDLARPRHRWRLPWLDAALLERWLASIVPAVDERSVTDEPDVILREVVAMAERWSRSLAEDRRARPVEAEGTPYEELAHTVADGARACRDSVRALARPWLARQRVWAEPILAQHAHRLVAAVDAVETPTAIDLVSMHAAGCLAIEGVWWQALASGVGGPLRAALVASYDPSPATEASFVAARDAALALVGEPDPWRLPWFEDFVASNLLQHATDELEGLGAFQGEGGLDLLNPWRAWSAICVAGGTGIPIEQGRALTRTAIPSVPERSRVRLWDREVALADLDRARIGLARPPVPGLGQGS